MPLIFIKVQGPPIIPCCLSTKSPLGAYCYYQLKDMKKKNEYALKTVPCFSGDVQKLVSVRLKTCKMERPVSPLSFLREQSNAGEPCNMHTGKGRAFQICNHLPAGLSPPAPPRSTSSYTDTQRRAFCSFLKTKTKYKQRVRV